MKYKKSLCIGLMLCILFIFSGCSKQEEVMKTDPVTRTEFVLGTVATVTIYDNMVEKQAGEVFDEIFHRLKEIETKMTINDKNSEAIAVNEQAGKGYVKVSNDTFHVVKRGKYFSELSEGKFDVAIGSLVKLWNIGTEGAKVPSQKEIDEKKQLVDYKKVLLNEEQLEIQLQDEGMILDLGGIAKGYAADEVVRILNEHKIQHAIINLGGNVSAHGKKIDGSPWRIGIQNPESLRGEYIGIVQVEDKTVVTSGIYERFFEEDGKKYHHLLDRETGYPAINNLAEVSIIADKSMDADALATAAFVAGIDSGLELIEKLDDVEAIFVTKDAEVYMTSGMKKNFKITDEKYKLMD